MKRNISNGHDSIIYFPPDHFVPLTVSLQLNQSYNKVLYSFPELLTYGSSAEEPSLRPINPQIVFQDV